MEVKKRISFRAASAALVLFLAAFAAAAQQQQQLTDSHQILRATLVGMEHTLPNGSVVVVDTLYGENGLENIGAVYLYDATRSYVVSALKGASAGDRIGSGGITVLANGDFVVNSPNWRSRQSSAVGAQTHCGAWTGCLGGAVGEANSLVGTAKGAEKSSFRQSGGKSAGAKPLAPTALGALIFDSITGGTYNLPTATRTFMGQPYNAGGGTTRNVGGGTVYLASAAAVTYTNITMSVQFWGAFDGAATPVFSNSLGNYTFILGGGTLAANNIYTVTFELPAPIALPSTTNQGVVFNFKGDTGAGLVNTDNLTTTVRNGSSFAVGSVPLAAPNFGYYRNASGRTDFNFVPGDARNIGANSALAFQLNNPAGPTAAAVTVGGRAVTAGGRGIRGVIIRLTDGNGATRTATTSAFGYYRFADVAAGETYVIGARGKRYEFSQSSRVLNVEADANDINFIAQ